MELLDEKLIESKVKRMSYQVLEFIGKDTEVVFIGIADAGYHLAEAIKDEIQKAMAIDIALIKLIMDKSARLSENLSIEVDLNDKSVFVIDDVSNSGRTLLHALKPILHFHPKQIHTVVLVDRAYKRYPITPDIVGYALSTTLTEKILVDVKDNKLVSARLEE